MRYSADILPFQFTCPSRFTMRLKFYIEWIEDFLLINQQILARDLKISTHTPAYQVQIQEPKKIHSNHIIIIVIVMLWKHSNIENLRERTLSST